MLNRAISIAKLDTTERGTHRSARANNDVGRQRRAKLVRRHGAHAARTAHAPRPD